MEKVAQYLRRFVVLDGSLLLVTSAWVVAAWAFHLWDRFPVLLVHSPQKRCGKTRLLQCIEQVTPNAINVTSVTPAVIYRLLARSPHTLLIDEAQHLSGRGTDDSAQIRQIIHGSIDRDAKVGRCSGDNHDVAFYPTASPKVVAHIGTPDPVLADRSLPVPLVRKAAAETTERVRTSVIQSEGAAVSASIEEWVRQNCEAIRTTYDKRDLPNQVRNDRLAEVLLPILAVLEHSWPSKIAEVYLYAKVVERAEAESMEGDPELLLLRALQKIYSATPSAAFLSTAIIIQRLLAREEEPWRRINRGRSINAEKLARLLRRFGVKSTRVQRKHPDGIVRGSRGYHRENLRPVWERYLAE